jgi:16S rRNA G966 N2-methylase RsmD
LRQNFQAAGFPAESVQARTQDVFAALAQLASAGEKFDLVFADPPYGEKNVGYRSTSLAQQLLDDENLPKLVKQEGLLVLGHTKRDILGVCLRFGARGRCSSMGIVGCAFFFLSAKPRRWFPNPE